jgi:hypothetical protein
VPRICGFYRGICLTTEEKARKNIRVQDRQGTYNVALGHGFVQLIFAVPKQQELHILSMFVALDIQHTKRKHRTTSSSVVCPGLQYISTLFHKRHTIRKTGLLNTKYEILIFLQICGKHPPF